MIEYSFSPVFYITVLKVFNGDEDRVNPREFIAGSFKHG